MRLTAWWKLLCHKDDQHEDFSSFIYLPLFLSDDDVLDTVHEQLTINAAGMHGAEEVSSLVVSFTVYKLIWIGFADYTCVFLHVKWRKAGGGPGNKATAAWCCASVLGVPQWQ